MKVRVKVESKNTMEWIGESVVTVLGMSFSTVQGVAFTIWSATNEIPVMVDAVDVELIDGAVSPYWVAEMQDYGRVYLGPPEWQGEFWDLYHDGDPDADRLFHDVMNKLIG